ncbi:MAG: alcohol dehydrogenase catalytic domain-containing protein [Deinococcus sp.]|nr:alcohol dehydrogenase catalytic domain-containing protein [Deinococcus sp.]
MGATKRSTDTMAAAVFEGNGQVAVKQRPRPTVSSSSDVLIKVRACGICGTDIHIASVPQAHPGNPGVILGHEYTGEVVAVGDAVRHVAVGDQVVVEPDQYCGECFYCRRGRSNLCENATAIGVFLDGGLATYNLTSARFVHRVSPEVPTEVAALVEPLACVLNGVQKLTITAGDSALIVGAGPIGLLFTRVLATMGLGTTIVADVRERRLATAQKVGATVVANPTKEPLAEVVREHTKHGAGIVVDCVGTQFATALEAVRRGGEVLLFGMNKHGHAEVSQYDITEREIAIYGNFTARNTFPLAIQMVESAPQRFAPLVSHRLPLSEMLEAMRLVREGAGDKVLVMP